MNFLTRLFKRKPKGIDKFGFVQYLNFQIEELKFQSFRWSMKEITEEEYIIAIDVIIDKMYQWIHEPEDQPRSNQVQPERRQK